MQYQYLTVKGCGTLYFFCQKFHAEIEHFRLLHVPQINNIGSMNDHLSDACLFGIGKSCLQIQVLYLLASRVLWCPGVDHQCVGTVAFRLLHRA